MGWVGSHCVVHPLSFLCFVPLFVTSLSSSPSSSLLLLVLLLFTLFQSVCISAHAYRFPVLLPIPPGAGKSKQLHVTQLLAGIKHRHSQGISQLPGNCKQVSWRTPFSKKNISIQVSKIKFFLFIGKTNAPAQAELQLFLDFEEFKEKQQQQNKNKKTKPSRKTTKSR